MLTLEMIKDAQKRISPFIYKTPLLRLNNLDSYLGCQAYAKMESFQKTGSFKVRGALNAALSLPEEALKKGLITASSGNHGKALAYAATQVGTKAYVVVPETAPRIKVEGIKSFGAEVVLSIPAERFNVANRLSEEKNLSFISPFDDYDVMAGQGTAGLEILEQLPELDAIVVPVGGGGLIGGISTAVKELNPKVKIIGVEPSAVSRYTTSIAAGGPVTLPPDSKSVADGLQTLRPGDRNYPVVQSKVDEIVTVDEEYILKAAKLFLTEGKLLAEISSCITIGAVLQGKIRFNPEDRVVFFMSGGNIGMDQFSKFEELSI